MRHLFLKNFNVQQITMERVLVINYTNYIDQFGSIRGLDHSEFAWEIFYMSGVIVSKNLNYWTSDSGNLNSNIVYSK